ncbi:hypothetical protein BH09BAC6_BH09BAC6_06830 [soil metagenome]|jgi:hypothetical protein
MKKLLPLMLVMIVLLPLASWTGIKTDVISNGQQPQIGVDSKGITRVVYGQQDKILCAALADNGVTFATPVLVAQVPGMHLGMSRGPQLASSANYSVITAMDKSGNIHWYRLMHSTKKWESMGVLNDLKGSAPEGLMGLTADKNDNFYAVWLDTRTGGNNQIYFSSLAGRTGHWTKNLLAYRSPDQHVCECCKPNIAVQGNAVAIMFRNWLNGSRDMYIIKSADGGRSFGAAQKLGVDTWKLNGCPMDGGGITISATGGISTTWQRKGNVYYCKPGEPETLIAAGRNCAISGNSDNSVITFQDKGILKAFATKTKKEINIGEGGFLKSAVLPNNKILYVWEQDNKIRFKTM